MRFRKDLFIVTNGETIVMFPTIEEFWLHNQYIHNNLQFSQLFRRLYIDQCIMCEAKI